MAWHTTNPKSALMSKTIRFSLLSLLLSLSAGLAGCAEGGDFYDDAPVGSDSAATSTRGYFELFKGADDQFYFHLQAGNYEILLASEGYQGRTGALNGILSVLDNGGLSSRYKVFEGNDGQFYVNLKARNGQIIGSSEGYVTAQGANHAVQASISSVAGYLEHWDTNAGARFQVFEDKGSEYRFNLYAANGQVVLSSEGYTTEEAALNGAFAVAENGVDEDNFDVRESSDGGFYLNLRAGNNEIIGTSEVYSTKSNAVAAMDAIIALIPEAELL